MSLEALSKIQAQTGALEILITNGPGNGLLSDGTKTLPKTNFDSSVRSCDIHLRTTSQKLLKIFIFDISLKIMNLISQPHLTGANKLSVWIGLYWICFLSTTHIFQDILAILI